MESDLSLWLPSTKSYDVKYYDSTGKLFGNTIGRGNQWSGVTREMQPLELSFFEIKLQLSGAGNFVPFGASAISVSVLLNAGR